nr:MAG TPA: hypothetical protein [Caudoviricetes sp.]
MRRRISPTIACRNCTSSPPPFSPCPGKREPLSSPPAKYAERKKRNGRKKPNERAKGGDAVWRPFGQRFPFMTASPARCAPCTGR